MAIIGLGPHQCELARIPLVESESGARKESLIDGQMHDGICPHFLIQDKLFNRVGNAVFQIRFGHEIGDFFHGRDRVFHRHTHTSIFDHRNVVFLIAKRHDLFRLNAQRIG